MSMSQTKIMRCDLRKNILDRKNFYDTSSIKYDIGYVKKYSKKK